MRHRFGRTTLVTGGSFLLSAALACSSPKPPSASPDSGAPPYSSGTGGGPTGGADAGLGGRSSTSGSGGAGTRATAAGSGAAGSGGAGGTTTEPNSPACTPPNLTLTRQQFYDRIEPCELTESSIVANPKSAWVHDLPLEEPLAAGQAHAVNLSPSSSKTPGSMEIWGASEGCVPRELLWFGKMEGRRQCAVFTPTQAHSRLMFIDRQLDVLDGIYSAGPATVSICPMGTCGATPDGMGLSPGVTLTPPPGLYESVFGEAWWVGEQWEFGISGRILFTRPQSAFPKPILGAVFRTPPHDPYGDAWYCAGTGSEWSRSERTRANYFALKGITRLPSCAAAGSGTATLTWDGPMRTATLTSSVSELNGTELSIAGRCTLGRCLVRMNTMQQDRSVHLFLHASGDFGAPGSTPNTQQMEIREALFLSIPKSGTPISYACTTSGNVRYDPQGTTSVTVQNLSSLAACGGTPAANASTTLVLE